jgi:hypothetical protein
MGYFIRVLGIRDPDIHLDELIDALGVEGLLAKLAYANGESPKKWTLLEVANHIGEPIAQIERNPILDEELGKEEIEEFKLEIENSKPTSSAKWLIKYLGNVKVIYAFQLLSAAFDEGNFDIITAIKAKIWNRTGGILQADNEGFSNEDGYHIIWQFSDDVTGEWNCAVRNLFGQWQRFTMELGDITQREEFQNGKVPKTATRL